MPKFHLQGSFTSFMQKEIFEQPESVVSGFCHYYSCFAILTAHIQYVEHFNMCPFPQALNKCYLTKRSHILRHKIENIKVNTMRGRIDFEKESVRFSDTIFNVVFVAIY